MFWRENTFLKSIVDQKVFFFLQKKKGKTKFTFWKRENV